MRIYSLKELLLCDGRNGAPALVAFEGKIYDLSSSYHWRGGCHWATHSAGADLTDELSAAPHDEHLLKRFPVVGRLENYSGDSNSAERKESVMIERTGLIAMSGKPLTLLGNEVRVGEPAPDVELLDNALQSVKISSFRGKVAILAPVPSIDTSVCDTEAKKLNGQAAIHNPKITIAVISLDLPFALARWCSANNVQNIVTLSDYRDHVFAYSYGVLIKELKLLARAVFVVDQGGIIRYIELVKDIAFEPNYNATFKIAQELSG